MSQKLKLLIHQIYLEIQMEIINFKANNKINFWEVMRSKFLKLKI